MEKESKQKTIYRQIFFLETSLYCRESIRLIKSVFYQFEA